MLDSRYLSPHFKLSEFTFSETAVAKGIDNTPNKEAVKNLQRVAYTLEIIRAELGAPIYISSGYRCPELNRLVGGSRRSKHMQGLAVDFSVMGHTPARVVERIRDFIGFNKLILEFDRWVHLDLSSNLRNQVLVASKTIAGNTNYEELA